jgi:GxxExxY protein
VPGTELRAQGFRIEQERPIALVYRGVKVDCAYRLDLIVEDLVIVEIKAIEQVLPIHKAQLLSYLRLADRPVGLLINFHVTSLSRGVHRVANGFFGSSDSVQSGSLRPLRSSVASVFKEPAR